jgi:vesicular inhibitory amino acid transporter
MDMAEQSKVGSPISVAGIEIEQGDKPPSYESLQSTPSDVGAPERNSSWYHTAALLLGDIVGTGVLSLAGAFATLGWVPAIGLLLFFSLANFHTGLMIHRVALLHPDAHSYGALVEAVFGDGLVTRAAAVGIYLFLFLLLGDYLLVLALSVQEIFWGWRLCRPIAAAIAAGLLLVTNQLRTLKQVAVATIVGTLTIMVVLALTLTRAGLGSDPNYDDDKPHPHDQYVVATPSFFDLSNSMTAIIFAYAGQTIYPEMISAMSQPEDFPKALMVSTPYLFVVYAFVGCVGYAYFGESAPSYLLDILNYNWTRTMGGVLMLIHMMISYTITQQILTRAIHRALCPSTVNSLRSKDPGCTKSALHWFGISTSLLGLSYLIAGAIPMFPQLNELIGSVFSPFLSFIIPCALLYKSGLEMTPLDKYGAIIYVGVVGVYALGAGTAAAVDSIIEESGDQGGPFACMCAAKQCF